MERDMIFIRSRDRVASCCRHEGRRRGWSSSMPSDGCWSRVLIYRIFTFQVSGWPTPKRKPEEEKGPTGKPISIRMEADSNNLIRGRARIYN